MVYFAYLVRRLTQSRESCEQAHLDGGGLTDCHGSIRLHSSLRSPVSPVRSLHSLHLHVHSHNRDRQGSQRTKTEKVLGKSKNSTLVGKNIRLDDSLESSHKSA